MARVIEITASTRLIGSKVVDTIEVEDDATEEEIGKEVMNYALEMMVDIGWDEKE